MPILNFSRRESFENQTISSFVLNLFVAKVTKKNLLWKSPKRILTDFGLWGCNPPKNIN